MNSTAQGPRCSATWKPSNSTASSPTQIPLAPRRLPRPSPSHRKRPNFSTTSRAGQQSHRRLFITSLPQYLIKRCCTAFTPTSTLHPIGRIPTLPALPTTSKPPQRSTLRHTYLNLCPHTSRTAGPTASTAWLQLEHIPKATVLTACPTACHWYRPVPRQMVWCMNNWLRYCPTTTSPDLSTHPSRRSLRTAQPGPPMRPSFENVHDLP